jgi:hypothetical protein
MYAQIEPEGKRHRIFAVITYHRNTVKVDQVQPTSHKTTKGRDLLVKWGDGTTSWMPLKDLKNSNPIEAAEYAVAQKLAGHPALAWWVRTALRARYRFIKKVNTRYWKRTHKNGIAMPKSVSEALAFDKSSGTDFWRKSIEK